jgi:hypothetical protein
VKEIFGIDLPMKFNDQADALLLGYAAYKRFFSKDKNEHSESTELL